MSELSYLREKLNELQQQRQLKVIAEQQRIEALEAPAREIAALEAQIVEAQAQQRAAELVDSVWHCARLREATEAANDALIAALGGVALAYNAEQDGVTVPPIRKRWTEAVSAFNRWYDTVENSLSLALPNQPVRTADYREFPPPRLPSLALIGWVSSAPTPHEGELRQWLVGPLIGPVNPLRGFDPYSDTAGRLSTIRRGQGGPLALDMLRQGR